MTVLQHPSNEVNIVRAHYLQIMRPASMVAQHTKPQLVLLLVCCLSLNALFGKAQNVLVFRVGAVLGNQGSCSEHEEIHYGYEFFVRTLNLRPMYVVDRVGNRLKLELEYERRNHGCNLQTQKQMLAETLSRVHFLLGSTTALGNEESFMAHNASRLVYHCCKCLPSPWHLTALHAQPP